MSVLADQQVLLRRSVRGAWPQLPLLTVGSVAVCAAAAVAALVAPGATPVSVFVLAVLVAPAAVALGAVTNSVLLYDDASFSTWWRAWRPGVRRGIGAVIPQAISGALLLVAIEAWQQTGQGALLVSVAVSGAVTAALVPLTAAMVHTVCALPDLSPVAQWRTAAVLVLRWPVRFIAAPVLLGFGVWLGTQLSVALLLLVPAPVALVAAAALCTSALESDVISIERESA